MGAYDHGSLSAIAERRRTRQIRVGRVPVGGGAPIAVQSMTTTQTADAAGTLAQVRASPVPLVADIHFDYRLPLKAPHAAIHSLRRNRGNTGSAERVREVVKA